MPTKLETFTQAFLKKNVPDIKPGDTVRVHEKIQEKGKERIQVFEGIVIATKHGKGITGTMTIRRVSSGIGVEKVFPLHMPAIQKIEITKRAKVRRAKLYYLRGAKGKRARLKARELAEAIVAEEPQAEKPAQKKEGKEKPAKEAEKKADTKKEEPAKEEQKPARSATDVAGGPEKEAPKEEEKKEE